MNNHNSVVFGLGINFGEFNCFRGLVEILKRFLYLMRKSNCFNMQYYSKLEIHTKKKITVNKRFAM